MAKETGISWTDSTFNPWIGCTKVSPGCDHCYAEALMDTRWGQVRWGNGQERRRTSPSNWRQPLKWDRDHEAFASTHGGRRRRVFCASLADVFDPEVPDAWRQDLWALIDQTPHIDWLLLTKRIGNAQRMQPPRGWPKHLWLGATIVNDEEYQRDLPKLLRIPAALHWVSVEPMLGPIRANATLSNLGWVVCGGESGAGARPIQRAWIDQLRRDCEQWNVPFFFKQWSGPRAGGDALLDGAEVKAWPSLPEYPF